MIVIHTSAHARGEDAGKERRGRKRGYLTKNSVKSRRKQRKNGKNYRFGEFLVRTDPGANGFRAEIVVLRPEGVVTYVESSEAA